MSRSRALLLSAFALVASLWLAGSPRLEARAGLEAAAAWRASCATAASEAVLSAPRGRGGALATLPVALEDEETDPPDALGAAAGRAARTQPDVAQVDRSPIRGRFRRAELPLSTGPPEA